MKKEFSTAWKASKQPRKQRKYLANAPLHIRRKFMSVNLSKELRKKHGKRNIPVRKGDVVKILRGKFRKKQGKVTLVDTKNLKVIVEGIQIQKLDGSKVNAPMRPSNLQIVELNLEDKKRLDKLKTRTSEDKNKSKTKTPEKNEETKQSEKKPETKTQKKESSKELNKPAEKDKQENK